MSKSIHCELYFNHKRTNTFQRRCKCNPNYQILDSTPPNGCGPTSWIKTKSNNFMSGLFDSATSKCCFLHDRCFAIAADTGLCSQQFSECLVKVPKYNPLEVFKRGVLDHLVRTSSYKFLDETRHVCKPVELPALNTMQKKTQQDMFSLRYYKAEGDYISRVTQQPI